MQNEVPIKQAGKFLSRLKSAGNLLLGVAAGAGSALGVVGVIGLAALAAGLAVGGVAVVVGGIYYGGSYAAAAGLSAATAMGFGAGTFIGGAATMIAGTMGVVGGGLASGLASMLPFLAAKAIFDDGINGMGALASLSAEAASKAFKAAAEPPVSIAPETRQVPEASSTFGVGSLRTSFQTVLAKTPKWTFGKGSKGMSPPSHV